MIRKNYVPDRLDRRLVQILQSNGRATLADLAEQIHLSISQTQRRLKRLEDSNVILGYSVRVNAAALGFEVTAYAEVTLKNQDTDSADKFHHAVRDIDEILECHRISGDADYMLRIVAEDLKAYSRFAQTTLLAIPQVDRLRSLIVFESPKNSTAIPVSRILG